MKTILVTGGAGFVGSNFCYLLLDERPDDYRIVCIDALTYAANFHTLDRAEQNPNFKFYRENVCNREEIYKIFETEHPDIVVNFAAETPIDRTFSNPTLFLETNILGTQVLLDACRKFGIERFHQVGTDEVYGDIPLDRTDLFFYEDTPIQTSSPYSTSKASADLLATAYYRTYELPITISRCSNNYGPGQYPRKFIPMIINRALQNKELPVYGGGLNERDRIYVKDHCRGILSVIEKGRIGEIYNLGSSEEKSDIEVVRTVIRELGLDESVIKHYEDRRERGRRYAIDSSKARTELGWNPEVSFDEGIRKTIEWYRNNAEWVNGFGIVW